MQRFVLILMLLSASTVPAHAEPASTLRYLTGEPATVMDLGLLQTTLFLKETTLHYINSSKDRSALYDPQRTKIILKAVGTIPIAHPDTARFHCQFTLETIQKSLGIEPKTGRRPYNSFSGMGFLFAYGDPLEGRLPESWTAELEQMTEVVVHIPVYHKKEKSTVTCRSPLRGTDIVFGKESRP